MSPSNDEFGIPSLDEMFPDLNDGDMPELEQLTDFSQGATFRQAPSPYEETHLITFFTLHDCACCHSLTRTGVGYAVRRIHKSRNACVEYQTILPTMYSIYDHLPKAYKEHRQTDPFCLACSVKAGFDQDADLL